MSPSYLLTHHIETQLVLQPPIDLPPLEIFLQARSPSNAQRGRAMSLLSRARGGSNLGGVGGGGGGTGSASSSSLLGSTLTAHDVDQVSTAGIDDDISYMDASASMLRPRGSSAGAYYNSSRYSNGMPATPPASPLTSDGFGVSFGDAAAAAATTTTSPTAASLTASLTSLQQQRQSTS